LGYGGSNGSAKRIVRGRLTQLRFYGGGLRVCQTSLFKDTLAATDGATPVPLPNPLITANEDTMSGMPVFAGTRVPVKNLFDYLEAGDSLDEFLQQFPGVSREHAVAVLELARARVAPPMEQAA
jgi:uncharacterized protein (DUF433 family)